MDNNNYTQQNQEVVGNAPTNLSKQPITQNQSSVNDMNNQPFYNTNNMENSQQEHTNQQGYASIWDILAIISMIIGIISFILGCCLGGFLGILGIILGILALFSNQCNQKISAIVGVSLSTLALAATTLVFLLNMVE